MESIISRARGASRETISEMRPQFFAWVEQLFRNRLMPSKLSAINKLMRTIFPGRKAFQKLVFYGEKEEEKKKGTEFKREIFSARNVKHVKSILSARSKNLICL